MYSTIFMIIAGFCLLLAGLHFFIKEKHDKDSRKVYGSMLLIGIVVIITNFLKFNL